MKNHKLQSFGIVNPTYPRHINKMIADKVAIQEETKMSKNSNQPDYEVCTPKLSKDGKDTFWQRIGSAWEKDGKISVSLNAHPIGDSIVLFTPKPKEDR